MTSTEVTMALSAIKLVTVGLGVGLVALALKAYRRSKRGPLLWLAIGMLIMTLGAISEGVAFAGLGLSLDAAHLIEGVVTLIAFGVLVYSLYA